ALVEAYAKRQGLWHGSTTPDSEYSQVVELDLGTIEPSIAGPKRPQDRIALRAAKNTVEGLLANPGIDVTELTALDEASAESTPASDPISLGSTHNGGRRGSWDHLPNGTNWTSNRQPMTLNGVDTSVDNGDVVIA